MGILWFLYLQFSYSSQLHQMFQIEGSNKEVNKFFKDLKIPFKSDTIFVFILSPGIAPRLEGVINPFIKYLRKQGIKNDIILLAISKKRAGEKYLKRMGFKADYQYVIDEKFLKSFEFSAGSLQVPFVTKFSISKGEMLSSFSLMGRIDSQTVATFIKDFSCPKVKKVISMPIKRKKEKETKINIIKKIKLYENEEYPLSSPLFVSINPSKTYLAITDRVSLFIYIFDLKTGKFINLIYPDSLESCMFIKLPQETYSLFKEIFKSMYFNHYFYDDSTLLITASLPRTQLEIRNNETICSYYNEACLIQKGIFSNKILKLKSFFLDTLIYIGNLNHTRASFIPQKEIIFLPFNKGWPTKGTEMLNEGIPADENPFREEFYEKDIYQFWIFDFDGKFIGFLGRLSKYFKDLKIGYSSSDGLVKFYDENYYTTDRFSGVIYKYDKDFNLLDSIKVFEINLSFSDIDYKKEPLRYILETFKKNFYRFIFDFFVDNDTCYVLLTEKEEPYLYKINLKNNEVKKYLLPTQLRKERISYRFIDKRNKEIILVALLENPEETFYCEAKVNNN